MGAARQSTFMFLMQEQPHATRNPAYRENLLRLNVRYVGRTQWVDACVDQIKKMLSEETP